MSQKQSSGETLAQFLKLLTGKATEQDALNHFGLICAMFKIDASDLLSQVSKSHRESSYVNDSISDDNKVRYYRRATVDGKPMNIEITEEEYLSSQSSN